MGSTTMTQTTPENTRYVGLVGRVRTMSAASRLAVRSCAHAGTPVDDTGELRLVTPAIAATDDVFAPIPGTAVPGGLPA